MSGWSDRAERRRVGAGSQEQEHLAFALASGPAPNAGRAQLYRRLLGAGEGVMSHLPQSVSKWGLAQLEAAAAAQAVQTAAQKQRQADAEKQARQKEEELAAAQEDEGVGQGEEYDTFADYEPSKVKLGRRHPDQTVETSSMSAVPPPDPAYRLGLPRELIEKGLISGLQLESIVYASMRHHITLPNGRNERAGFLLGDGAGIGKGRQISGIIYENFRRGRESSCRRAACVGHQFLIALDCVYTRTGKKSVWFSASADLAADASRDFADIGASKVPIINLPDMPYTELKPLLNKKNGTDSGVLFSTYSCLISGSRMKRIDQLAEWCGKNFDGCLVFDECHKVSMCLVAPLFCLHRSALSPC
eukprot:COSAG02_NODE_694_length_18422_cov_19.850188_3_plen_361_part_00